MNEKSVKGRVNFGQKAPLNSISESHPGEEVDSNSSDELEFIRLHTIQAIVSAKSALKVFKAKALMAQKNRKRDSGLMEVITFNLRTRIWGRLYI